KREGSGAGRAHQLTAGRRDVEGGRLDEALSQAGRQRREEGEGAQARDLGDAAQGAAAGARAVRAARPPGAVWAAGTARALLLGLWSLGGLGGPVLGLGVLVPGTAAARVVGLLHLGGRRRLAPVTDSLRGRGSGGAWGSQVRGKGEAGVGVGDEE